MRTRAAAVGDPVTRNVGVWGYKAEVDPQAINHVWKVIVIAVVSGAGALLLGGFLPADRPLNGSWFVAGVAVGQIAIAVLGLLGYKAQSSRGGHAPHPIAALVLCLGLLVALTLTSIGLSGPFALYRPLLLLPVLVITSFGGRYLVVVMSTATIVAVVFATMAQGLPLSALATVAITYGFGWGGVIVLCQIMEREAVSGIMYQRELGAMAASLARAENLGDGLAEMLPVAAGCLHATAIEVRAVNSAGSLSASEPVARWSSSPDAAWTDPSRDEVHEALTGRKVVLCAEYALLPLVAGDPRRPFVAIVTARAPDVRSRMLHEYMVGQVHIYLDLLVGRMQLLRSLEEQSRTDSLTGLANRRALIDRLAYEREAANRERRPLTVVMIDVDHFKDFNDTYGHVAGDRVLADLAGAMRSRLRATDLASRYGGEEFCLVLPHTSPTDAVDIVETLHSQCRVLDVARPITFSAGIAAWVPDETVDQLVERADQALYEAKADGRDRSQVAGTEREVAIDITDLKAPTTPIADPATDPRPDPPSRPSTRG